MAGVVALAVVPASCVVGVAWMALAGCKKHMRLPVKLYGFRFLLPGLWVF